VAAASAPFDSANHNESAHHIPKKKYRKSAPACWHLTARDLELLLQIRPLGPSAVGVGEAQSGGVSIEVDLKGILVVFESCDEGFVVTVAERGHARG
jgi:hypothetical protein